MNITNQSPEHYKGLEKMPELAERLAQVRRSVSRTEQAIEQRFPGALDELSQDNQPEAIQPADATADTPEIHGYGHSDLTPDNIISIREAINRSASAADTMKPGIDHDTQKAA